MQNTKESVEKGPELFSWEIRSAGVENEASTDASSARSFSISMRKSLGASCTKSTTARTPKG
jgi:hypothetical protein